MNEIKEEVLARLALKLTELGLDKLIARISRPSEEETAERKFSGEDIAMAISITRPIRPTVEKFLAKKKIMAQVVEIEGRGRLPPNEEDWTQIVSEFYEIVLEIQSVLGAPTYHLFVSAPASLTFALGAVLGLNYDVNIYHWFEELNDYKKILNTSRKLLG